MSREEAIKALLEENNDGDLREEVREIKNMLAVILDSIIVQQKDACQAAGVSPDTVRNKVLSGEIDILHAQGSRLNFMTLKTVGNLKKRKPLKRRRG